jgi:hypothetical protein
MARITFPSNPYHEQRYPEVGYIEDKFYKWDDIEKVWNVYYPAGSYAAAVHSHVIGDVTGLQSILQQLAPAIVINSVEYSLIDDETEAVITVNASGGIVPFQYNLDDGAWQTGNTFIVDSSGEYYVYVKDSLGNIVSSSLIVLIGLPFQNDIIQIYERNGNILQGNNYSADILTPVAEFTASEQRYIYNAGNSPFIQGGALNIKVRFKVKSFDTTQRILECGAAGLNQQGIHLSIATNGTLAVRTCTPDGSATATINLFTITLNTWYNFELNWNGLTGDILTWSANELSGSSTTTKGWTGNSIWRLIIGAGRFAGNPMTSAYSFFNGFISYVEVTDTQDTYVYNLTGLGNYTYSLSGHGHLKNLKGASVNSGTDNMFSYDKTGSFELMNNGYKLFVKENTANEYVPIGQNTNHLSGYSEIATFTGAAGSINMYPCLIDFNPGNVENSDLEIFDRSNEVRCTALARGDNYNELQPSRWHISELVDPRIHTFYFNDGFAGKLFAKIETEQVEENIIIKKLLQQLNYNTDKKGTDQVIVMIYCGTDIFIL